MKNKNILLLLGPNLNMTGVKEKGIYGEETAESITAQVTSFGEKLGMRFDR